MSVENLKLVTSKLGDVDDQIRGEGSDARSEERVSFYRGEFSVATLSIGERIYKADVYDISASGAAILPKNEIPGLDSIGQVVHLIIGGSKPRKAYLRSITHTKFSGSYRLKLGLEFEPSVFDETELKFKINCHLSKPLAYCEDPVAFDNVLLFNVDYFTPQGFGLSCDNAQVAFYDGLVLDVNLMFPVRGEIKQSATIMRIKRRDGVLSLHCRWNELPDDLSNAISEFLLMSVPGMSVTALKENDFKVKHLERAFIVKCASSPEEFYKILELRLMTAQGDGRWIGETDPEVMRDCFDQSARHLYCEVNGEIVAAGRMVFNDGIRERSEHIGYGVEVPEWLWKKGFVECSRLCTHPNYRGSNALLLMLLHLTKISAQSGHLYGVINCVDSLVRIYIKYLGANSLKIKFFTEYMKDNALNLLYVDVKKLHGGLSLSPIHSVVYGNVGQYTEQSGLIKLSLLDKIKRAILSFIHKVTLSFVKKK